MNIGNTICVYCYLFCQLYLKMLFKFRHFYQIYFDIQNQFKTDKSFQFQSLIFNIELLFIKKNKNLRITQRAKRNLYCILTSWKLKHWNIDKSYCFHNNYILSSSNHLFYLWIHSGIIYLLRLFFTGYAFKIGLLLFSYCFIIKMRVEEKR